MRKAVIWVFGSILVVSLAGLGGIMAQTGEGALDSNKAPTDTAAWALARYATDLKYGDLPADVVATTKRRILDTLGCVYGAYTAEPMVVLRNVVTSEGGTPESTIIGSGQKTSAVNATWANGSMIRYLDFSDTYPSSKGFAHPSNGIAAALAVAERQHASGRDLILAVVLAYEIQARLADTFNWGDFSYHSGAGFEAPVVAGRLLGLTEEQMANAIGIGASHDLADAGDYGVGYTSSMKAFGYAAGSGNGVLAALMAQNGFTGPVTIIESFNKGFMKNTSLAPLVDRRSDYAISRAWMKFFEAYYGSQSAITAVVEMVKEQNLNPDQIAKIFVRGLPEFSDTGVKRLTTIPRTKEDADHNLPFVLAVAIMYGELGIDQYAKEQWKDPQVQALMGKVEYQGDAEMIETFPARLPSSVQITTNDGRTYTKHVDFPKGAPENPFTDQELESKFNKMALKLMPKTQADQIISTVYNLDKLNDVSDLTKLLKVARP